MIVPMQRLTLLCSAQDRQRTIDAIAALGVVHVIPSSVPGSGALEEVREQIARLESALETLPKQSKSAPSGASPVAIVDSITSLANERTRLGERLAQLRSERDQIEPLGDFEPRDIAELAEKGLHVRLYRTSAKREIRAPEGAALHVLHVGRRERIVALVSTNDATIAGEEIQRPDRSLREIVVEIASLESRSVEIEVKLRSFAGDAAALRHECTRRQAEAQLIAAREGMRSAEPIACLSGYSPVESAPKLREAASREGWAVMLVEPAADEDVPTLVRNPRWIRPIENVFGMTGILPGYREVDVSPVFLLFLSVFFALLVGDAGYGALFFALTLVGRWKLPSVPKSAWSLLMIMSLATIAWGVASGAYFGCTAALRVRWLDDPKHVMLVCFSLGAVHLTIAHLWAALRCGRTLQSLAQIGWVATTWTMFCVARTLVLGAPFPSAMIWVFFVGVASIVLFMTPPKALKGEWFNHVMLPLSLVSNFVDVVSYLRLFAVGTAGYQVAKAFNEMALAGGVRGVLATATAASILFFGHALNVLLSAMGVLVHGVRLNTLEFSAHLGMQWTGTPYQPLVRREN